MCGIAGIIDFHKQPEERVVLQMLNSIIHRGPDDMGIFTGSNFSAGMRRLSIIDISSGHQPIFNEDKKVLTFFNGEIYNYIELREELIKHGHKFMTNSDTEVIVHSYEEYGMSFLNKLNGMFAIFIADIAKKEFYIARDRYGIKPMYFSLVNDTLIFGSELKSILKSKVINGTISSEGIINYLNYLYIPSPKTAFREIQKLEAGTYLKKTFTNTEKIRWYNVSDYCSPVSKNAVEFTEELRWTFEDSVRLQMRSDVPVGAYLSGGIDSSLITAIASGNTDIPLNTFSVGFTPSEFDELPYARKVSDIYKTNHHELIVSAEDAIKQLPLIMGYMDDPIGDSAVLPSFLISKLAVSSVKVALSGLGGDELFGGYGRYKPVKSKIERLWFIPKPVLKSMIPLISGFAPVLKGQLERMQLSNAERYHFNVQQMSWEMIEKISGKKLAKSWYGSDLIRTYNSYPGNDEINQRMFTDIQLYMNDQLLHLTDRVSMAVSIESRVPFLDHRLVELSLKMPSALKLSQSDFKIILKNAFKNLLPDEILFRPKWGFAAPYKTWTLTDSMNELVNQTMEGTLIADGILDKKGVHDFLGDKDTTQKYSTWVWPLISLELWYSKYRSF